jgi:hypothetical protein
MFKEIKGIVQHKQPGLKADSVAKAETRINLIRILSYNIWFERV